jgi:hypothetical protein
VSPAPQPPLRGSRILQHVSWFVVAATWPPKGLWWTGGDSEKIWKKCKV